MIVPISRLSPAAREIYYAGTVRREKLLILAVREHPEDWSLLSVARAWRAEGATEAFRRVSEAQWSASNQRDSRRTIGRRSRVLTEWWNVDAGVVNGHGVSASLKISEVQSPEEACLVLDAQWTSVSWLLRMRTFATDAIKKFGEHPALVTWRARARYMAYIDAYPDGDPRAKNPGGIKQDRSGASADARRAVELAPREPGVLAAAGEIMMRVGDPSGPAILRRYAATSDPWPERRARTKAVYPAYFP